MTDRLKNKVALVTGAARGIGRSVAELFLAEGATVIATDRDDITDFPGAHSFRSDITDAASIAKVVAEAEARFGRIDVLINNAGVNVFSEPLELSDADWDRCFSIDLKGAWNVTKAVLPLMLKHQQGSIVNIASVHGHKIIPHSFPYPVAKHGLIGMSKALGIEYAAKGIRVNSISPGLIETPQVAAWLAGHDDPVKAREEQTHLLPCKRIGQPIEVAYTALFLATDEARYINATDILIDGGRTQLYHD